MSQLIICCYWVLRAKLSVKSSIRVLIHVLGSFERLVSIKANRVVFACLFPPPSLPSPPTHTHLPRFTSGSSKTSCWLCCGISAVHEHDKMQIRLFTSVCQNVQSWLYIGYNAVILISAKGIKQTCSWFVQTLHYVDVVVSLCSTSTSCQFMQDIYMCTAHHSWVRRCFVFDTSVTIHIGLLSANMQPSTPLSSHRLLFDMSVSVHSILVVSCLCSTPFSDGARCCLLVLYQDLMFQSARVLSISLSIVSLYKSTSLLTESDLASLFNISAL